MRLLGLLVVAVALAPGCAGPAGGLPTGVGSAVIDYAYFSKKPPPSEGLAFRRVEDILPPSYREFEAGRDETVVFVAAWRRHPPLALRGVLKRPDGSTHDTFTRTVPSSGAGYTVRSVSWRTSDLAAHPGEWALDLLVDDRPVGTARFTLIRR